MKKTTYFKSLLLAAGLCVGANAWADWTTVYSNDYTNAETYATGWAGATADRCITGQGTRGSSKCLTVTGGSTNGTACTYSGLTNTSIVGTAYGSSEKYKIEFDMGMIPADGSSSSADQTPSFYIYDSSNNALCHWQVTTPAKTAAADGTGDFFLGSAASATATFTANKSIYWYHIEINGEKGQATTMSVKDISTSTNTVYTLSESFIYIGKFVYNTGKTWAYLYLDDLAVSIYSDAEVVSNPTIGAPVYAGANRTVTITGGTSSDGNTVTTYYTTDGTDPTSSSSVYESALNISSDCTVKAISISSEGTESSIVSQAVTVGKLTLAAPTFTKTAYSAGSYTITIADDQSGLEFVPASTTIKYRVGTSGDFATYSAGVSVATGQTLYAYVEADNYTTSSTAAIVAVQLPAMTFAFGQNYVGVVDADLWMAVSAGPTVTNAKSTSDANYFIPSNDGGTTALTDENISFQFSKHSTDDTQDKKWGLKTTGMYADYGRGYANVKIDNLTVGQIVVVDASAIHEATGLTELTTYSYGNMHYYVASATTAYLNIERQKYIYSINVYDLDNETVGALDNTSVYWGPWNTLPVWINAGETGVYKFVNYNKGEGDLFCNWYLFGATEGSDNVVQFGPNHSNTATNGTYESQPTFTMADLNGATVEVSTTLTKDAEGDNYTLTSTAVTTKADGTVLSPNLVYKQTGITVSKLKLYVTTELSWLELLKEAVKKNVTAAGYATYYSNNALDFSGVENLSAYTVEGASGGTLTLSDALADVPAETPVLIEAAEGTYTIPVIASSSTVVTNKLEGVHVATEKSANSIYVLMASPSVGFYKNNNAFTVGANTAYLPSDFDESESGARAFYLFGDESTGINAVQTVKVDGEYYNLSGQRVAAPQKGLYIVNGKKVIVK